MHCPFCGSNLNSATTFCRRCGNKVRFLFDANDAATGQGIVSESTADPHLYTLDDNRTI